MAVEEPAPAVAEAGSRIKPVALGLLAFVVLGIAAGVLWWLLAPLPEFQLVDGQPVPRSTLEDETAVAADGWFAVCAAVGGFLSAVLVFFWVRTVRIAALAGLTMGGLVASVVAWRLGVALGPDSLAVQVSGLGNSAVLHGPLHVSAAGVLLVWSLASVVVYFALAAGVERKNP